MFIFPVSILIKLNGNGWWCVFGSLVGFHYMPVFFIYFCFVVYHCSVHFIFKRETKNRDRMKKVDYRFWCGCVWSSLCWKHYDQRWADCQFWCQFAVKKMCCEPKHWTIFYQQRQMKMYNKSVITYQLNKLHIPTAYTSAIVLAMWMWHICCFGIFFSWNLNFNLRLQSLIAVKTTVKDQLILILFPENIKDHTILFTHLSSSFA